MLDILDIPEKIIKMTEELNWAYKEIELVKLKPMTNASIYMKPDKNGEKTIMQLIHKNKRNGKRHEYIGKNKLNQMEAASRIQNFEYHELLRNKIVQIEKSFEKANELVQQLSKILNTY